MFKAIGVVLLPLVFSFLLNALGWGVLSISLLDPYIYSQFCKMPP